jgi:hypothetical protein
MNRIQHAEAVARAAARYARQAHKVAKAMKALARAEQSAQNEKSYLDALTIAAKPLVHESTPMWVDVARHVTETEPQTQAETVRPRPSRPPMTAVQAR